MSPVTAALASGALLCLTHGYAPFLAIFAPVPLLLALRVSSLRQAFYSGLLCGVCEAFVLCGMLHARALLLLALCAFYGLGRALFAWAGHALGAGRSLLGPPTLAALWVMVERLQAATPFSLPTLLGDTQHVGPFLPLARLGGTYLVSFQIVWLSAAATACVGAGRRQAAARMVSPLLSWALLLNLALHGSVSRPVGSQAVNVVQGGLPTWFYVRSESDPAWAPLPEQVYLTQSERAPAAALTVWPETAVWRVWGPDASFMAQLRALRARRGPLLVGLPRVDDAQGLLRNSAVLLGPAAAAAGAQGAPSSALPGSLAAPPAGRAGAAGAQGTMSPPGAGSLGPGELAVDKQRLGLRAEAQFTPGIGLPLLPWAPAPLGVVFCLESVVPEYARALAAQGAGALVVLAEGSRFGGTPVGRLHAQRSVVRAVETGRTVIHAGQHGYSQIIGPRGDAELPLPPFVAAVVHGEVGFDTGLTPFVRYGDATLWPEALLLLAGGVARGLNWRRARTHPNRAA